MRIDPASGAGRFLVDLSRYGGIRYEPYGFQANFHGSPAPYGFLGGAAGPGKTTGSLMELFVSANEFNEADGPQVHQLALRRTYPQLEATVITRFRELFPKSLYRKFNETRSEVTWRNGATLKFGSMQYESDAWAYQGQWKDLYYDELCDFTFTQWMATSAWNRCPVSRQTRKWGSGNPIGIGAVWVEDIFVKHVPCMEMDRNQRQAYDPKDYPYFEATFMDNPVYANDPVFLKNLEAYPEAFRDALKFGIWGAAGGYFRGVFDEAIHVFPRAELKIEPWWKQWISGNWGFAHAASYYKHCMDDEGVVYTYDELFEREKEPEELATILCEWALENGEMPHFHNFAHSFDAAATKKTATMGQNVNSVNNRMVPILRTAGIPDPHESTRDKLGRDTLMREKMRKRIRVGEDAYGHPLEVPAWQIADRCTQLRRIIPVIKANPDEPEKMEGSDDGTDSPLQGAGYGLYAIFGRPAEIPKNVQLKKVLESAPDNTAMHLRALRFEQNWQKTHAAPRRNPVRWQRRQLQ
jgi:terminase large subunit-like protein